MDVDSISNSMPQSELLRQLLRYKCPDITPYLDFSQCETVPFQRGGWGDVYKGRLTDGRPVAIRCVQMNVGRCAETSTVKGAAKELYAWSRCTHNNLQELSGIILYQDRLAIVTPWIEHSVLNYIDQHPNVDRLRLCSQIADGLEHLHQLRPEIVHGDIKAENVMVDLEGTAKLTDFGSATIKRRTLYSTNSGSSWPGTVRWTARELLLDSRGSLESDVYGLGMTILEILTGKPPFEDLDDAVVMVWVWNSWGPPTRPSCIPHTSDGDKIWSLLNQCWATNPSHRPSATRVKHELGQLEQNWHELQSGAYSDHIASGPPSGASMGSEADFPFLTGG